MFPKIDPKKMQAMMKQMGIAQEDIDANRVTIECDDKNIIIDNGFNYSYDVQFYIVNGTIINNDNISINKLKIIGNFYDIDGNKIISRWDHISNVSYLTEKKFEIILRNHYAFVDFNKIALIKFEFEIIN